MAGHGVALAATLHDPVGRTGPAIARLADTLRAAFPLIALNISDATRPEVIAAARAIGGPVMIHAAGEAIIGKARRDAVMLAGTDRPALYADFDHMLRWVEADAADLSRVLAEAPEADCLVVGRSPEAIAAGPARLRETERLVDHCFGLLTGHQGWDLMFAMRRLSPRAIGLIGAESAVDTLANDVEWPLLAWRAGLSLAYTRSDALFYRTIDEFGAPQDSGDGSPLEWIRRVEFAALHAAAMRPFLANRM